MDAPGRLLAIWNQLLVSAPELSWYTVAFAIALPLEAHFLWALGANIEGSLYGTGIMWLVVYGGHADVRLDLGWLTPIRVGPSYHRLHHGRSLATRDTNFAQVFPLFDLLGGAYRRPRADDDVATGLDGCDTAYARWRPLVW